MMENQKDLIHDRNWDVLIILDACRYDYFEDMYNNFLDGKLQKVISPGCWTGEWINRTFRTGDFSDVVYVSSTPHVNSAGFHPKIDMDVSEIFHRVIDVWDFGWDESLGTTSAENVVEAVLNEWGGNGKEQSFIVHFNQPHTPYLGIEEKLSKGSITIPEGSSTSYLFKLRSLLKIPRGIIWKMREFLGKPPTRQAEYVFRQGGAKKLKENYSDNVKYVLKNVRTLTERLEGNIIITSDHGECLGEGGKVLHTEYMKDEPILREVPWFEIEK